MAAIVTTLAALSAAGPASAALAGSNARTAATAPDTISTVVGGTEGPAPATKVVIDPCSIKSAGNQLYIADDYNDGVIRAVNEHTGALTSPAGVAAGALGPSGRSETATEFFYPCSAALDQSGNLVVADTANNRVMVGAASSGTFYGQKMTAGHMYTVASAAPAGFCYSDSGAAFCPVDAEPDHDGNLVVTDVGEEDQFNKPALVQVIAGHTGTYYGQQMTAGQMYIVAGGGMDYSGDGGPAVGAGLGVDIGGVRVDASGNLVIPDSDASRIRVVAVRTGTFYGQQMTAGDIYTVAGDGNDVASGDGGPALKAGLSPSGVALDAAGNLVIADARNRRVRVVAEHTGTFYGQRMTTGDIYTVAGTGQDGSTGNGGPARKATFGNPDSVAVDSAGNIAVSDQYSNQVRVVATRTGTYYGKAMTAHDIYTVAGSGTALTPDGGPAVKAALYDPNAVAVDRAGNTAIADEQSDRIKLLAARTGTYFGEKMTAGDLYTIAGDGSRGFSGDGGPARSAKLNDPGGIGGMAFDAAGNLVFNDSANERVRVVAATTGTFYGRQMTTGDIYTIAGDGQAGHSGDGVKATKAELGSLTGLTVDRTGNVLLGNSTWVQVVATATGTFYGRRMTTGDIYTIAGDGQEGYSGDGGPATKAELGGDLGVAVDRAGNVAVADGENNRVQLIAASTGTFYGQQMTASDIYTVAGSEDGQEGYSGVGGLATKAVIGGVDQVAVDGSGNLLIADDGNRRVLAVPATTGTYYGLRMTADHLYSVAGDGQADAIGRALFSGDGGPATAAGLDPSDLAVTPAGGILTGDFTSHRVRLITG